MESSTSDSGSEFSNNSELFDLLEEIVAALPRQ